MGASPSVSSTPGRTTDGRLRVLAFVALIALGLGLRVLTIYTEEINWDEFGLLHRAHETARTGRLVTGGRPGLAVVALLPFVEACLDEIDVVRSARVAWMFLTFAYLFAVYLLVRRVLEEDRHAHLFALCAVGFLFGFAPVLRFSLQVRTDQIALCFGTFAIVSLLASRRHLGYALLAGALLGVGALGTQKAVYVFALGGLLWLFEHLCVRRSGLRPMAMSAGLAGVGFAGVYGAFRWVCAIFFELPPSFGVGTGLSAFDFYRQYVGLGAYQRFLLPMVPHGLAILLMAWASGRALVRGRRRDWRLLRVWLVLALGVAVGVFHAGTFPYFFMTLFLFPALAFGFCLPGIRDAIVERGWQRHLRLIGVALGFTFFLPFAYQLNILSEDTQATQAESLRFVKRNFPRDAAIFHPEQATFCQRFDNPFGFMVTERVHQLFYREPEEAQRSIAKMLHDFRTLPVQGVVSSGRIFSFPEPVQRFIFSHYVRFYHSVFVAGFHVTEKHPDVVDVYIPGDYRYLSFDQSGAVVVNGRVVQPGQAVRLEVGRHELRPEPGRGVLVLAPDEPSHTAPNPRFFRGFTTW